MPLKILNLYAGIGGNRKEWGREHEITAVEINPNIGSIYKDLYPEDNVIIGDAHEYLRAHFREFDFIWASPPCPTHSRLQTSRMNDPALKYPDMTLYQEIIFLKHFFKGKWVIENVKPYYEPLIQPSFMIDRHYFWSNKFIFSIADGSTGCVVDKTKEELAEEYGFELEKLINKGVDVRKILRNCVKPEIGRYILEELLK